MPKAKAKVWCFNLTWKLYYTSKSNSSEKLTSSKSLEKETLEKDVTGVFIVHLEHISYLFQMLKYC